MANRYFIGLDLGQAQDFTALAVVERTETKGDWDGGRMAWRKSVALGLRHLERVALGTSYPEIVGKVRGLVESSELVGQCELVVDATGVGRPVVDLLQLARLGCRIRPVVVTGGLRETRERDWSNVPKRDLMLRVQLLLQEERLKTASHLKYGAALVKEMADMRVKISAAGNEQFGAWREGSHDDLVFAVALACWGVEKACGPVGAVQYWGGREQGLWEYLV